MQPTPAPSFSFTATNDLHTKLSDYLGQHVVLYFYPKDNTPGCTQETQDFASLHHLFEQKNAIVFGVSKDSLTSHERFKKKYNLPFELISDPDGSICEAFNVFKEKSMFGRSFLGIERSTFLIDHTGNIVQSWRKVKVKGHAQAVLEHIDQL